MAWLVALLLVAEPLRNSGRYTVGDVLSYRMRQRPVRTAAAVSTISVSIFYLLAQMVGAGALVSLLLGFSSGVAKNVTILCVGALMIIYVTVGGMRGTTWVQIVKAVLLMSESLLIVILVMARFGFNLSSLLGAAAERSGKGTAFLEPGKKYGKDAVTKLDFISLAIALVLGTAALPHILVRFYTVPTARAALAHDLYASVIRKGQVTDREEIRVARISAGVIGAIAIVLSLLAQNLNIAFLVALAFAVAASGNLPAILYSLFWKRFNTRGAVWAIYGGLITCLALVIFSPVVSGNRAPCSRKRTSPGTRCRTPASGRAVPPIGGDGRSGLGRAVPRLNPSVGVVQRAAPGLAPRDYGPPVAPAGRAGQTPPCVRTRVAPPRPSTASDGHHSTMTRPPAYRLPRPAVPQGGLLAVIDDELDTSATGPVAGPGGRSGLKVSQHLVGHPATRRGGLRPRVRRVTEEEIIRPRNVVRATRRVAKPRAVN